MDVDVQDTLLVSVTYRQLTADSPLGLLTHVVFQVV